MKITRLLRLAALAAASLLGLASPSRAGLIQLSSDLGVLTTPGNYTTVGDKTFQFLSYQNTQNPAGGGAPIGAGSIDVSALSGAPTATPYGFELSGPIAAVPNTFNGNDILLTYTVTTSGPGITAVNLAANGHATGSGFAEVVESVFVNDNGVRGAFLGQLALLGAGTARLDLGGAYSSLYIFKDIQFSVLGGLGTASYSFIDQTFEQGANPVPEPSTLALAGIGVGMLGVAAMRRKRAA